MHISPLTSCLLQKREGSHILSRSLAVRRKCINVWTDELGMSYDTEKEVGSSAPLSSIVALAYGKRQGAILKRERFRGELAKGQSQY